VSRHHGDRGGGGHKATARDRVRLGYEQEEEEAPDLRARAVSGRREGARRVSGRAAGPAAVWRAREKASWAAAQAEGKGEQRPGKEKGEGAGQ